MRFALKDYQRDAVSDVLSNFANAGAAYRGRRQISAFSLTATTGAGKTVMAAAVIEALFYGDDALDFEADPGAVVLWFSDDPSLNEQTRYRLLEASDRIPHGRLVVVESDFHAERFARGAVYFLNTSKLSRTSLLVRGYTETGQEFLPGIAAELRPDSRSYTIWDTIRNTINDTGTTLYMILDEAHRGMRASTRGDGADIENGEKMSIVQRLINGHAGVPAMPIVWGISATVTRFDTAMRSARGRMTFPAVLVDSARVQASGLVKDDIHLDIPAQSGVFDTVLVRRATRKLVESTAAWEAYARTQDEPSVVPLMVLQTPNTPEDAMITRALDVVYEEWPELKGDAVAHVFADHGTREFGPYRVPYIKPEHVQDAKHVRVLLAKDAVSTGWDCPRAEVLVSFRPARDETHITQLLGRMVRTPLARRVPGDDRLNSVACLLPLFDRQAATAVVKRLMKAEEGQDGEEGGGGSGGGEGRRVLLRPREMTRNPEVPDGIWSLFESLPSFSLPRRGARPVRRLMALAQALVFDGLRSNAGKEAHAELHAVLDGLSARYASELAARIAEIEKVGGETIHGNLRGGLVEYGTFVENADERAIDGALRRAGRAFTADLARTYVEHIAPASDGDGSDDEELRAAHLKIVALAEIEGVREELDRAADLLVNKWLTRARVAIKGLSDARQAAYNEIRALSPEPQRIELISPTVRTEETEGQDGIPVPTRTAHLLCDEMGAYPVGSLNSWEVAVLDAEMSRSDAVAWFRNPPRAVPDSLALPYRDSSGQWRSLRPDFIFFRRTALGGFDASLVDPHSVHLADALLKLRGLADLAANYGSEFHRIEAVAKVGHAIRVLDLQRPAVREAIGSASSAEAIYLSKWAADYVG